MPRVFAYSDLHVDNSANMTVINALSSLDYLDDVLILAGDTTDSMEQFKNLLDILLRKFSRICFVPGNHELWIRQQTFRDSIEKYIAIRDLCCEYGIETAPVKVGTGNDSVWLVPLFSWYRIPEQGEDSLYFEKICEDSERTLWADLHFCKWPDSANFVAADFFLQQNGDAVSRDYDAPIISFSHMLPRRELIFDSMPFAHYLIQTGNPIPFHESDPFPSFNFTRFAGDYGLERQIRRLGSIIHVYGHQHRNRDREIDGVRYISHCLGYPRERRAGNESLLAPLCIWSTH